MPLRVWMGVPIGIGMVTWLLLMTPVEIHYVHEVREHSRTRHPHGPRPEAQPPREVLDDGKFLAGVLGAATLAAGWFFFFVFQYISCYKVCQLGLLGLRVATRCSSGARHSCPNTPTM